jgi:hypothetical protein
MKTKEEVKKVSSKLLLHSTTKEKLEAGRTKKKDRMINNQAFRSKEQPIHISYFVAQILGSATA